MKIFEAIGDMGGGNYQTAADRERGAKELTEKFGYAAAALTLIPIPGTEWAVMSLHVGLVMGIGQIYGKEVTRDSARELVMRIGATVGLSIMGLHVATTAVKMIPFLGGVISAPFMYASTQAIGTVARVYFERGGISDDELESVYKDTLARARKQFDPTRARSPEAQDLASAARDEAEDTSTTPAAPAAPADDDPVARLERLKRLLDKGLIEPEEYAEVKRRVLDSI